MTRTVLAVLLLSATAHAQAVRPAPPLIHQQPPSLPGATHAPAGAGASHGSLPGTQKASLPPSPNKRALPASREDGLWAADGAPEASVAPPTTVFGFHLPYPGAATEDEKGAVNKCATTLSQAVYISRQFARVAMMEADVRRCLAYRAYELCIQTTLSALRPRPGEQPAAATVSRETLRRVWMHAAALAEGLCRDATPDAAAEDAFQKVTATWLETMQGQTPTGN
jgi:hypothetical protein